MARAERFYDRARGLALPTWSGRMRLLAAIEDPTIARKTLLERTRVGNRHALILPYFQGQSLGEMPIAVQAGFDEAA